MIDADDKIAMFQGDRLFALPSVAAVAKLQFQGGGVQHPGGLEGFAHLQSIPT